MMPLSRWMQVFDESHTLTAIFEDLRKAIQQTMSRVAQNHEWRRVTFIIQWIDPVIHGLLNLDLNVNWHDSASIIHEACRLGIILFVGEVRRKCGVMCVSTKVYVSKLQVLLLNTDEYVDWTPFNLLRLWLLFFGMLESRQQPEARWYVESVRIVVDRLNIGSWEGVVAAVKRVLWFEGIFDPELENFREDVMSRLFILRGGTDDKFGAFDRNKVV
jgi:hypothetical protein